MGGKKGAKADPRRLHPLFLRDADGSARDWNLQARLRVDGQLPPLNREGDGAQALNIYLRRHEVWNSIRAVFEHQGEQLTTYSFRHRYAKGMDSANVRIANISEAMGDTNEVHLESYTWFKQKQLKTSLLRLMFDGDPNRSGISCHIQVDSDSPSQTGIL